MSFRVKPPKKITTRKEEPVVENPQNVEEKHDGIPKPKNNSKNTDCQSGMSIKQTDSFADYI